MGIEFTSMCYDSSKTGRALISPDDPKGERKYEGAMDKVTGETINVLGMGGVCDPVDVYSMNKFGKPELERRETSIFGALFTGLRNLILGTGETPYATNAAGGAGVPTDGGVEGQIAPKQVSIEK